MKGPFNPRDYRVLVVDYEPSVLFTYRLILEQEGYQTSAVASAREALQKLQTEQFDIVLCDYSLEEKHTGLEVIVRGWAAYRVKRFCGHQRPYIT